MSEIVRMRTATSPPLGDMAHNLSAGEAWTPAPAWPHLGGSDRFFRSRVEKQGSLLFVSVNRSRPCSVATPTDEGAVDRAVNGSPQER